MKRNKLKKISIYLLITLVMILILTPVFLIISNSLMTEKEIYSSYYPNFHIIPKKATLQNYFDLFKEERFYASFYNSLSISIPTTLLVLIISSMASYSISRMKIKKKGLVLFLYLFTSMLPTMAILLPLYIQSVKINIYDTKFVMILVLSAYITPFSVWILKSFFDAIPSSLEEAAMIDGCNRIKALLKIILPLSLPGLGAVSVFAFIASWSEFLIGIILTSTEAQPYTVYVGMFVSTERILFGQLLASAVVAMIPVIAIALIFQNFIVKGLIAGAVKG